MKTDLQLSQSPTNGAGSITIYVDWFLDAKTVEYPMDGFSKTDPEPIYADRNRSMISAIIAKHAHKL